MKIPDHILNYRRYIYLQQIKLLFLVSMLFILSGCMAETFLGNEDQVDLDLPKEFPDLHDVPARPAPENMDRVAFDLELADESNTTNLAYNAELRKKMGLQVGEGADSGS